MDIQPIGESSVLDLLTLEMEGPEAFEEALVRLDCLSEAQPYLSICALFFFFMHLSHILYSIQRRRVAIRPSLTTLFSAGGGGIAGKRGGYEMDADGFYGDTFSG